MNNLPTTFEDLLNLLKKFVDKASDQEFRTYDPETIGENIVALLEQYEVKESK